MLTKTFKGQDLQNASPLTPEKADAVISRFTEIFNAIAHFQLGHYDARCLQNVMTRIIEEMPENVKNLNKAWQTGRRPLLKERHDAYLAYSETWALLKTQALATYLTPSNKEIRNQNARVEMANAFKTALAIARQASGEYMRVHQTPDLAHATRLRLTQTAQLAAKAYSASYTYEELMQRFKTDHAAALESTMKLAELDLAYMAANVIHFKNIINIRADLYLEEMRNTQSAHFAATAKTRIAKDRVKALSYN